MTPLRASALIAGAYFACGVALYGLGLDRLTEGRADHPMWLRVVVLAAVCAPILWRRIRPSAAVVVAVAPLAVDVALGPGCA